MEPARSTLFILLDGMMPNEKGLASDPCESYEAGNTWGTTGIAKYLQEDITNSKALVYSRAFRKPAASPLEGAEDFADRSASPIQYNCKTTSLLTPVYDKSTKKITYGNTKSSVTVNDILDEAVEHWFAEQLMEASIPASRDVKNSSEIEKLRATWNGTTPNASFSALAPNIDSRLLKWINEWKSAKGSSPSLADLRNSRPDLIPSHYVIVSQGTGGLVAREYIQGGSYRGDIDKTVFFNTPHEGSGFADEILFRLHSTYIPASPNDVGRGTSRRS